MNNANTYHIPTFNMRSFEERMAKIIKKGNSMGLDEISYEVVDTIERKLRDHTIIRLNVVEVTGTTPKFEGWEFIAKIEHDRSGLAVVKSSPGKSLPEELREQTSHCDHCDTKRFRKNTYVVRSTESGRYLNIGSSCIKDFMGWGASPDSIATMMSYIYDLQGCCFADFDYERGRLPDGYEWEMNLEDYLTFTAIAVRKAGWISKKLAAETQSMATVDLVSYIVNRYSTTDGEFNKELNELRSHYSDEGKYRELAQAAIEWAKEITDTSNEYMYNVKQIATRGVVSERTIGISTSIVAAYERAMDLLNKAKKNAADFMSSDYVGESGERLKKTEVTCHSIFQVNSTDWAGEPIVKDKITFLTPDGNVLIWFCSGVNKFEKGMKALVNATILGHKTNNGKVQYKYTSVNRVHLVKEI